MARGWGRMKKIRKTSNRQQPESVVNAIIAVLKGSLIAIIITLFFFTLFAVIIKVADLQESIIPPVVQVVRTLCIAFGGLLAARASKKMGWLKGGITGILYILIAFIISSLFGESNFMGSLILSDLLLGAVAGAVGGIIGVNI